MSAPIAQLWPTISGEGNPPLDKLQHLLRPAIQVWTGNILTTHHAPYSQRSMVRSPAQVDEIPQNWNFNPSMVVWLTIAVCQLELMHVRSMIQWKKLIVLMLWCDDACVAGSVQCNAWRYKSSWMYRPMSSCVVVLFGRWSKWDVRR